MKILFAFIFLVSVLCAEEKVKKETNNSPIWEYDNAPKEVLEWFDKVDFIPPPEPRPATAVGAIEN
jgi:hypothetical protein